MVAILRGTQGQVWTYSAVLCAHCAQLDQGGEPHIHPNQVQRTAYTPAPRSLQGPSLHTNKRGDGEGGSPYLLPFPHVQKHPPWYPHFLAEHTLSSLGARHITTQKTATLASSHAPPKSRGRGGVT